MRRAVGLICAASLLAALPAGGAQAGTPKKSRCTAEGAKTVVRNSVARVFTTPGRGGDEVRRLYGCVYKSNRRMRIDTATDDDYVLAEAFNAVKLNRHRVAWQHSSYDVSCKADCPPGYDPSSEELRVRDLRKKRGTRRVRGSLGEGTALVVTAAGAIAWVQPGAPVSVRASDRDGTRVLYAGDDVDGGSLSLSDNTVAWLAGGQPMSATLR